MKTEVDADRKAFVTLRFAGDDLSPEAISAILPVEPTRAHRKGEEFAAGTHGGKLRGRTGMWFLATDKLVPGDDSRMTKLRTILEHSHVRAHLTCFWRGDPGETAPTIPPRFKSLIEPLAADIETDFAVG